MGMDCGLKKKNKDGNRIFIINAQIYKVDKLEQLKIIELDLIIN